MQQTTPTGSASTARWPWSRSLALAGEGETFEVEEILFASVQQRCEELGIRPGTVLLCDSLRPGEVGIILPDGTSARIPRHYAWFVAVSPL
jgi:hypothetical protein